MAARPWLEQKLIEWDKDPEFVLEGVLLVVNERICKLMQKKGITRSELARRLGRSRAYVTRLLNGQPNLTLMTLTRIAIALGEGLDVFIPSSVTEERKRWAEAYAAQERAKWVIAERSRWHNGSVSPTATSGSVRGKHDEPRPDIALAS